MPVYFVQAGDDGPIKIGFASNVLKRLPGLQVNNPARLRALGIIDGDRGVERELHLKFSADRVGGEWFTPSPELLAIIAEASPVPTRSAPPFVYPTGRQWTVDDVAASAGGVGKLAQRLGVSHSSICDWKRAGTIPADRCLVIGERLGIDLGALPWRRPKSAQTKDAA